MIAVPHPVASAARARPAARVLEDDSAGLTARELCEAAACRAGGLAERGLAAGDVVGLVGPAGLDWVVGFHAIGWLGGVVAPLPASPVELARALPLVAPAAVVTARDTTAATLATLAEHARAPVFAAAGHRPMAERFWPLDEARLRVLTSGSSGAPHAATLTTAQLVFNAFGSAIRLGLSPHDVWLACLPLHHVGGAAILWRSAFYGTGVRLLARFDPAAVNAVIDAGGATLVSLVPAMLARVLVARGDRPFPPSLRAILLGGAAAPPGLLARCRAVGAPLAVSWGMSETASQVATTAPGDGFDDGMVGPPLAFARVDATAAGRLFVEGPLAPGGAFVTADLGAVEPDGRVRVRGRADDVIVTGGKKVDPLEVEQALTAHPAVAAAVVVGVADENHGERPVAFLVGRAGVALPADEDLRAACALALPRFAVPARFLWRAALPTTDLGKPARAALRAEAAALLRGELR